MWDNGSASVDALNLARILNKSSRHGVKIKKRRAIITVAGKNLSSNIILTNSEELLENNPSSRSLWIAQGDNYNILTIRFDLQVEQ